MLFMESATDRRSKIIRLTDAGIRYVEEIIPPAAEAEVDAMCALSEEDARELVRLTAQFFELMWKNFEKIGEGSP